MPNEERMVSDNEIDPERSERDPESGEECWDVDFTANGEEPSRDLYCEAIENYGTGSDVEQFYKIMRELRVTKIYKPRRMLRFIRFLRKNNSFGGRNGKNQRSFRQFSKKLTGSLEGKRDF